MTKTIIRHVTRFNQLQRIKWSQAVEEWKRHRNGGFPFLGFYVFTNQRTGEDRKYGYVLSKGNSHRWFKTKKQAMIQEFYGSF